MIEIGTKARALFASNLLCDDEQQDLVRKECQNIYAKAVSYLQENLPFDVLVLKYLQYLHPEKRINSGSTHAICNLAFRLTRMFSKAYYKIFNVSSTFRFLVCDQIRFQWVAYQLNSIPSNYYIKSDSVTDTVSVKKTNSYWSYALELCDLSPPIEELRSKYVRIDHYWRKVGGILKDDGTFKYAQLFALVKLLVSISHGNSVPETGFWINIFYRYMNPLPQKNN